MLLIKTIFLLEMIENDSSLSRTDIDNANIKQDKYSNPLSFYDDYSYDRLEQLPKIENLKNELDSDNSSKSKTSTLTSYNCMPELSLFENSYSYDDSNNGSREYTYDHSVYPRTKVFTNNSTISKKSSSKKVTTKL